MYNIPTTDMGAEDFMNYLDRLYYKYVELVNQQFSTYFASEEYAHVALLGEALNNMRRDTAKFASALEVYRGAIKSLPPLLFADGVEVDIARHAGMDYGGENTAVQIHITLLRAKKRAEKLLLVEVADSRVENNRIVFSEKVLLPYSFYKFLRYNVCIEKDMQFDYYNFLEYVKVALRGGALCVFDRARKLQALLAD